MNRQLLVPDMGDFEEVEVIEVLVKVADKIKKNDSIVTLESDKSSVEVPSIYEGTVESVNVKVGDKVSKGHLLVTLKSESQTEKISEKNVEEKLPTDTENIIKEAEDTLVLKKEIEEPKILPQKKNKNEKIEIIQNGDIDPIETKEWLESLSAVLEKDGKNRAQFLIKQLIEHSYKEGSDLVLSRNTPYINTIPPEQETKSSGDQNIERKIRSLIRWNAAAMVVRANKKNPELGGHIGTFASAATLYDVGMNHFWRAKNNKFGGDLIYFQGHSAPGMYARAFLEGRITSKRLDSFRQEVKPGGLSSYPHPWLMPKFWQFPVVSMGLGAMMSIYQARFTKYLINRGLLKDEGRKVWTFLGDGEMDEPESLGAIGLAAREKLDNLIFVVNCNLQRLDGPVRGNGKIIQELEGIFRGAGWNVIKVIWGSYWDPLLAKDKTGMLIRRMGEAVDGEYQAFKAKGGAYVRENFFGKYPELLDLVSHMTDKDVWKLNRVAAELRTRISKLSSSFPNLKEKLKRISISEGEKCPECNQKIEVTLHKCESNKKYIERKIHTFHSYCYDQLKKNETKKLAKFLEPKENKLLELRKAKFFEALVQEIGSKNKAFYKKINKFFLSYLQSYKNIFDDITSMEEYVRLIKPRQVALKIVEEDDEEVHLQVKSIEELEIANFLYLRGIEFKYEDEYKDKLPDQWDRWDDSRTYKPDFHLFKKNEKGEIEYDEYYEHFALDKKLNPPKYFRDIEKYKKDYEIKKKLFDGKLICTYSYQKIDDTLFDSLVKQLRARGIKVPDENVVSDEEAIEKFREAGYFTYFASLLSNFLTHFKLRESKLTKLKSKVDTSWFKKLFEGTENKRARVFVEIFELIYTGYQQKLQKDSRVDYEDMLIEGKKYIENQNLKFLIVDEFQDISPLRARVLQQIQKYNKNIQLFSVGDDWQSIYRFSGGDIKIIVKQYDQYFGKREMVDLGLTYRFNDRLCELTSSFILKNKDGQLDKKIRGRQDYNEIPLSIFKQATGERSRFKINFSLKIHLLKVLNKIFKEEGNSKLKILFLARYNDYIYRNGYEDLKRYIYSIFKSRKRFIEFSTIHSAKGDEADYVFLMNVNDGYMGFPSTIENDPILKLVIDDKDKDNIEHAEERRLFYVALTRTKKKVYLYGERGAYFIEEIYKDKNNKKGHHHESADIPVLKDPNKLLVVAYVKGNKNEVRDTTPAKNIELKSGDEIIQVNDKKNPRKKDLIEALRDCEGREINLHIKNKSGAIIKKIKPFNKNEGKNIKKRYDIGATFFEREVDPFVDKLLKEYSLDQFLEDDEINRKD